MGILILLESVSELHADHSTVPVGAAGLSGAGPQLLPPRGSAAEHSAHCRQKLPQLGCRGDRRETASLKQF